MIKHKNSLFVEIMSSLIRALSWPLISQSPPCPVHEEKNGSVKTSYKKIVSGSPTFQQLMAARRLLCRRYYPEGGWGWIITVVGMMVNALTHGIQLSYGIVMFYGCRKFGENIVNAGKN